MRRSPLFGRPVTGDPGMSPTMGCLAMGKKRGRPKRSERDDVTVKVDRTTVGKAKLIATHRGVSVAELLSDLLRAPIDKAYAQMLRDLEKTEGGAD
jgi:hypothetical protein